MEFTQEQIDAQFGWFVDAFQYGTPPHGGFALGLDRFAMLLCGCDSLRDVIAFPLNNNARDLLMNGFLIGNLKQVEDYKSEIEEFFKL